MTSRPTILFQIFCYYHLFPVYYFYHHCTSSETFRSYFQLALLSVRPFLIFLIKLVYLCQLTQSLWQCFHRCLNLWVMVYITE